MLTRDSNKQYLESLKNRLEDNGIPAVIQGDDTARMTIKRFLLEPTLWVYLDEQFDDAVKLMMNPEHYVRKKVNVHEFYTSQPTEHEQNKLLNEALVHLGLFMGVIMLGMFLFIKILD